MTIHERFWRTAKRDKVYADVVYFADRDRGEWYMATFDVSEPQSGRSPSEAMRRALAAYERSKK
jgi:hypothetical protein